MAVRNQADEKAKINKKLMLEVLEKTLGNVAAACKRVGISRGTYYAYLKFDEEFAQACMDIRESAVDFAESKLLENIKKNKETSIIFYLKTQGKNRGYIERLENINVEKEDFENMTDDQLREAIEKSIKNAEK